jgi:hypothetical protein
MVWIFFIMLFSHVQAFEPAELMQASLFAHPCDKQMFKAEALHCPLLKDIISEEQSSPFLRPSTYNKTVITGASVSAGYGLSPAKGPTDHFVQAIGMEKNKVNHSMSGGASRQILNKLYATNDFNDATLVVAVDMFFWDTVRNPDCSLASLQTRYGGDAYRKLFQKKLILATVPLFNGLQKPECVEQINRILQESCKSPECLLLDGDKLFVHDRPDLMQPDGLHPNQAGNQHLSEEICRELINKN